MIPPEEGQITAGSAHGKHQCAACLRNIEPCQEGKGCRLPEGMHWDTCPNRVVGDDAACPYLEADQAGGCLFGIHKAGGSENPCMGTRPDDDGPRYIAGVPTSDQVRTANEALGLGVLTDAKRVWAGMEAKGQAWSSTNAGDPPIYGSTPEERAFLETKGLLGADARPSWSDTWLDVAKTVARRSSCTRSQVGAVLVGAGEVVLAIGINGAPAGFPGCETCPRAKAAPAVIMPGTPPYSSCVTIHAEVNCLLRSDFSTRMVANVLPGQAMEPWRPTLYVTREPCPDCRKVIVGSGVQAVVFERGNDSKREYETITIPRPKFGEWLQEGQTP